MKMKGRKNKAIALFEVLQLKGHPWARDLLKEEYEVPEDGIAVVHECSEHEVKSIVELWNSLPYLEQSRCHIPGFAIRIWNEEDVDFIASICWECDNILLEGSAAMEKGLEFNKDRHY